MTKTYTNTDGDTAELTEAGVAPSTGADLFSGVVVYVVMPVALVVGYVVCGVLALARVMLLTVFVGNPKR
jgi:hypothetical protein